MESWIENEINDRAFPDARLANRLKTLIQSLSNGLGDPIPLACQDWAATKAAYRFFDNPRVDERAILAGHFEATRSRFAALPGLAYVLHDTTEFSYHRTHPELIGKTTETFIGKDKKGRPQKRTVCGLLMHSSMVLSPEGLPVGLGAVKFWTRKKFKGTNALKKSINPTRMPIEQKESYRWIENMKNSTELLGDAGRCVHIGDRESDIYELFCTAQKIGTHFLVRTCADRMAENGCTTVAEKMSSLDAAGVHRVEIKDKAGNPCVAELQVRYCRMTIHPPVGKQKRYPSMMLTVIHANEETEPIGRERIEWKLLTDLSVTSLAEAIEKLDWYAMRWKIETFHKILKSGCKAEESKLRTAERLICLLAINCILSWRIFWLCMVNRTDTDAPAALVFDETELEILEYMYPAKAGRKDVATYLDAVARLGGYLARRGDSPPGNMVLWRGFSRLTDIHLGFVLGRVVGN